MSKEEEEKALFRAAMHDVKRLDHKKTHHENIKSSTSIKKKPPSARLSSDESSYSAPFALSDPVEFIYDTESALKFQRVYFAPRQWKSLERGQNICKTILDLHAMTIEEAREALCEFLVEAQQRHIHYVHIVHGKGGRLHQPAILKNHVAYWLQQIPFVQAFVSAPPSHGGTGALFVVLKVR